MIRIFTFIFHWVRVRYQEKAGKKAAKTKNMTVELLPHTQKRKVKHVRHLIQNPNKTKQQRVFAVTKKASRAFSCLCAVNVGGSQSRKMEEHKLEDEMTKERNKERINKSCLQPEDYITKQQIHYSYPDYNSPL